MSLNKILSELCGGYDSHRKWDGRISFWKMMMAYIRTGVWTRKRDGNVNETTTDDDEENFPFRFSCLPQQNWMSAQQRARARTGGGWNGMWNSEERNRITSNQTEWRRREQKAGTKINSVFLFLVGIKNFISAPEPTFFPPDGGWAKYRRNRNEKETKRY